MTIVFAILIVLVIVLTYLFRRIKLSDVKKKRFADLKKKIFFNAIIRYSLVNTLKLNMIAMIGIA